GSGLPRRPRQGRGAKSVSATGGGVSPPSRAKDICTSARSHDGTSAASRRPSDDLGRSGQAGGASLGGSGGGSAGALGACSPSGGGASGAGSVRAGAGESRRTLPSATRP